MKEVVDDVLNHVKKEGWRKDSPGRKKENIFTDHNKVRGRDETSLIRTRADSPFRQGDLWFVDVIHPRTLVPSVHTLTSHSVTASRPGSSRTTTLTQPCPLSGFNPLCNLNSAQTGTDARLCSTAQSKWSILKYCRTLNKTLLLRRGH